MGDAGVIYSVPLCSDLFYEFYRRPVCVVCSGAHWSCVGRAASVPTLISLKYGCYVNRFLRGSHVSSLLLLLLGNAVGVASVQTASSRCYHHEDVAVGEDRSLQGCCQVREKTVGVVGRLCTTCRGALFQRREVCKDPCRTKMNLKLLKIRYY